MPVFGFATWAVPVFAEIRTPSIAARWAVPAGHVAVSIQSSIVRAESGEMTSQSGSRPNSFTTTPCGETILRTSCGFRRTPPFVIAVAAAMTCIADTATSWPIAIVGLERADHCDTGLKSPAVSPWSGIPVGLPNPKRESMR